MNELYRVGPRKAKEYIIDVLEAGLVPFVQSSPGIGKSSIFRTVAAEFNLALIDHRLSTSPPEDLSGLPQFKNGKASFAPFEELFPLQDTPMPLNAKGEPMDGWLVFLDEFNSAKKDTQAASYKLILDRMTGQHKLHDKVLMGAAGNLMTDHAIVNPLSTAMQSRVVHIEMVSDFTEWLEDVAIAHGYDHRLIAFLNQYPSKLMDFVPGHSDRTFCCPRTWEFMNKLIKGKKVSASKTALYAGTITSGVAAEFTQFIKVYDSLVKFEEVMANPESVPVPTDASSRWAVIAMLAEKADDNTIEKLSTYADRMPMNFRVLFYRMAIQQGKGSNIRHHPRVRQAMMDLAQYL